MTAAAVLAGLYPPVEKDDDLMNEVFNDEIGGTGAGKGIGWQPIPIHTVDYDQDSLLHRGAECPVYKQMFKDVYRVAPKLVNEAKNFANLWKFVKEQAGVPVDGRIDNVWWISDAIYVAKQQGWTPPAWTTEIKDGEILYDHFMKFRDLSFVMMGYNDTMRRLAQGNMINQVRNNMQMKINGTKEVKDVYLYAGHDDGISPFLQALGYDFKVPPYYVNAVILELWKDENMAPKVKLYYRNDKDVDPPPDQPDRLNIERDGKKCPGKCPMSTFFQITDKMVPKDFKKECGVNEFIKQLDVAGCSSALDMSLLFPLLAFTSLNNCVIVLMQS